LALPSPTAAKSMTFTKECPLGVRRRSAVAAVLDNTAVLGVATREPADDRLDDGTIARRVGVGGGQGNLDGLAERFADGCEEAVRARQNLVRGEPHGSAARRGRHQRHHHRGLASQRGRRRATLEMKKPRALAARSATVRRAGGSGGFNGGVGAAAALAAVQGATLVAAAPAAVVPPPAPLACRPS